MEEGLFERNISKGRCHCLERVKPLRLRALTVRSYFPRHVWGKAKEGYDGRKLLLVQCNRCGRVWKDYSRSSRLWALIGDSPDTAGERLVTLGGDDEVK